MFRISNMFSALGSLALLSGYSLTSAPPMPIVDVAPRHPHRGRPAKTRRRRPGFTYPHSSTRQRARYGRQRAAGQLNLECQS